MVEGINEIGSNNSFDEQQRDIIKRWGADSLLEDSFKKHTTIEELQESSDQEKDGSVRALFDEANISLKSELNTNEVLIMSRLLFITQRYRLNGIDDFIMNLLKFKVSHQRRGRREFIEGLHAEERKGGVRELGPITAALSRVGL